MEDISSSLEVYADQQPCDQAEHSVACAAFSWEVFILGMVIGVPVGVITLCIPQAHRGSLGAFFEFTLIAVPSLCLLISLAAMTLGVVALIVIKNSEGNLSGSEIASTGIRNAAVGSIIFTTILLISLFFVQRVGIASKETISKQEVIGYSPVKHR